MLLIRTWTDAETFFEDPRKNVNRRIVEIVGNFGNRRLVFLEHLFCQLKLFIGIIGIDGLSEFALENP